jgi:hypothetical protein
MSNRIFESKRKEKEEETLQSQYDSKKIKVHFTLFQFNASYLIVADSYLYFSNTHSDLIFSTTTKKETIFLN